MAWPYTAIALAMLFVLLTVLWVREVRQECREIRERHHQRLLSVIEGKDVL